jgi:glutamate 5-kinase
MVTDLSPFSPGNCKALVVKVGSALLVDEDGKLRREWLQSLTADIADRRARGQRIVVVSSGAIALGARRLGLPKGGRASLEDAQAAAATGQILLSQAWAELLGDKGITAAQMLLTLGDLEDRRRFLNAAATLERLLGLGVVPVLNENDSVATEEIRFGDNDRLAARVGQAAAADGVLLLSNIDGLFTADPRSDPAAELIARVDDIDAVLKRVTLGESAAMGSGGMGAKVAAARIACKSGIPLGIAQGTGLNPLVRLEETGRCTLFAAVSASRARKAWLAGRLTSSGRLTIDAGAVKALQRGGSLLAAGVRQVDGKFARGDAIEIADENGHVLARGLAGYDIADARAIAGKRTEAQADILGYAPRSAMVHRDHLVLL